MKASILFCGALLLGGCALTPTEELVSSGAVVRELPREDYRRAFGEEPCDWSR